VPKDEGKQPFDLAVESGTKFMHEVDPRGSFLDRRMKYTLMDSTYRNRGPMAKSNLLEKSLRRLKFHRSRNRPSHLVKVRQRLATELLPETEQSQHGVLGLLPGAPQAQLLQSRPDLTAREQ
jgi:hypothetical protein